MAHIIEVTEQGMKATDRCDRCDAQAYVEVALGSGGTLLFCAHHATENWDGPKGLAAMPDAMIADHRKALAAQESKEATPV